jgi:hypothetical protein
MRRAARHHWGGLLFASAAFLIAGVYPPSDAAATGSFLAVRLAGGQGGSYPLSEIERISFGNETLEVVAVGGTDAYALGSIVRIDFELGEWTGIDDPGDAADVLRILHLFQNQPNPFGPETRIVYELPQGGRAELRIYAVNGRLVRRLAEEVRSAGRHSVVWDGLDESGRAVSSGVYFYTLAAPGVEESRKMLLLR